MLVQVSKTSIIIVVLILIVLIEAVVLFTRPVSIITPFDDSQLRREISILDSTSSFWESRSLHWALYADSVMKINTDLENQKPIIQIQYRERYNFNNSASTIQLDSVIRANW